MNYFLESYVILFFILDPKAVTMMEIKELLLLNLQKLTKIEQEIMDIESTQKYLMSETTFIKLKIQSAEIANSIKAVGSSTQRLEINLSLPAKTQQEFLSLESQVKVNDAIKLHILNKFGEENSTEFSKFIRRNLKKIISDDAAINFTWTGANKNIAIKDFELIDMLLNSVLIKIPMSDRSTCEEIVKSWFRDAKIRQNIKTKSSKKIDSENAE